MPFCILELFSILLLFIIYEVFPDGSVVNNPSANTGDTRDAGSIPGWGRSPWLEIATHSSILALEYSLDRRARQGTVHGVTESDMRKQLNSKSNQLLGYHKDCPSPHGPRQVWSHLSPCLQPSTHKNAGAPNTRTYTHACVHHPSIFLMIKIYHRI